MLLDEGQNPPELWEWTPPADSLTPLHTPNDDRGETHFKGWMEIPRNGVFSFHFPSAFFLLGVSVLINIHKIWWFPKSDFKHFETPVFPLCIYRITLKPILTSPSFSVKTRRFFFPDFPRELSETRPSKSRTIPLRSARLWSLFQRRVVGGPRTNWGVTSF